MKTLNQLVRLALNAVAGWYKHTSGLTLSKEDEDLLYSLVKPLVTQAHNSGTLATLNDMQTDLIMRLYVDACRGGGFSEHHYTHAREAAKVFMKHYQADLKKAQAESTEDK